MESLIRVVVFHPDSFRVILEDGRQVDTPYSWYPRLENATPEQREAYELSFEGIHWLELDEDICIHGLLAGERDNTKLGRERMQKEFDEMIAIYGDAYRELAKR
ncbi:DUF2442 domain-containing protein [Salmonella enterica subsp. enterica serovar Saintpaul]|nr:DUF2442 domain-containing protein [Salmonella enterica subsp. enterica serovar Saintpaul]